MLIFIFSMDLILKGSDILWAPIINSTYYFVYSNLIGMFKLLYIMYTYKYIIVYSRVHIVYIITYNNC